MTSSWQKPKEQDSIPQKTNKQKGLVEFDFYKTFSSVYSVGASIFLFIMSALEVDYWCSCIFSPLNSGQTFLFSWIS